MDSKNELKKLSRKELLEILLEQTKRIEDLEIKLDESEKKLASKKVSLSETGNLAEAALKLSDIFKNADDAIAIYKLNIEESIKKEEKKFKKECRELKAKLIADTEAKCVKKAEQTAKKCAEKEKETEEKCNKIEKESENRIKELEKQIKDLEKKIAKNTKTQTKQEQLEEKKEENLKVKDEKTSNNNTPKKSTKKTKRESK